MRVRLKDIAEKTGFSVNTVSLALNDSPRISEETRQLIKESANEFNYVPNKAARSLITRKSKLIGLIVREFNNNILSMVAAELERSLYALGYNLVLVTSAYPKNELEVLRTLESQQVDGIFMYPSLPMDHRVIEYIHQMSCPVVLLSFGDYELFTDAIYIDREYAAYLATSYLISLGHKKIAFFCGASSSVLSPMDGERLRGYCRALNEAGLTYNPSYTVLLPQGQYRAGYDAARALYHCSSITAILGCNDAIACGAMQYYLEQGVRIPEDISFVSNDSTEIAAFSAVPMTATRYNVEALTAKAVEVMMQRLESNEREGYIRCAIPSTLDIRSSTAAPRE